MDVQRVDPRYRARQLGLYGGYGVILFSALLFLKEWRLWVWSPRTLVTALSTLVAFNALIYLILYQFYRCLACGRHFRNLIQCIFAVNPFGFPDRCPRCLAAVKEGSVWSRPYNIGWIWLVIVLLGAWFWHRYRTLNARTANQGAVPHVVGIGTWPPEKPR
jgi:hypothetical protein